MKDAFDIEEVVAEYNILRGCIHNLAIDNGFNLQGKPFHLINRVFDQGFGLALQTYATQRALEIQQRREATEPTRRRCSKPCVATCSNSKAWFARC